MFVGTRTRLVVIVSIEVIISPNLLRNVHNSHHILGRINSMNIELTVRESVAAARPTNTHTHIGTQTKINNKIMTHKHLPLKPFKDFPIFESGLFFFLAAKHEHNQFHNFNLQFSLILQRTLERTIHFVLLFDQTFCVHQINVCRR